MVQLKNMRLFFVHEFCLTPSPPKDNSGVAFCGNTDIAVAHSITPFVSAYPWTPGVGFGVKYADPGTKPTGNGYGVAFMRDYTPPSGGGCSWLV